MSDSNEYEPLEFIYPTKPKPPVTKPKPVAAAERPPVASSTKALRKPMPRPKPVVGPNKQPKSSLKPQRRSEYSGPAMPPQSPSWTSGNVGDHSAPRVPTSPRPVLPSAFRTPPPSRHAYPKNFSEREASQVKRTRSMDDGSIARASLSSPSNKENSSLSLDNFVSRYGSSLPLHVRVDKGFCSDQLRYVISADDEFIIHFIKHRKVITLTDSDACQHSIPSNSPVEVAPLYNPNNNTSEALKGFTFGSAGDIASLSPLPKCVRVTKSYQGSDSKCSVEKGELLIVEKASRTAVKRKAVLKVFSITKNEGKSLNEDCEGHFTTKPDDARLLLMQAIQHMPDPFPMEAKLYMTSDVSRQIPIGLSSKVVTLTHSSIETLLVATTYCKDNASPSEEDTIPVEIPIHLDIDVSVIPSQDHEAKNKDPTSSSKSMEQTSIHQSVQLGNRRGSTEIEKSTFVHDTRHRVSQTLPNLRIVAEKASVVKDTPVKRGESVATSASTDVKQQLAAMQLSIKSLKTAVGTFQANCDKQFSTIQDELVRIAPIVDNLSKRCISNEEKLKQLQQLVMATLQQQQNGPAATNIDESAEERNRSLMRSLTHIQVGVN